MTMTARELMPCPICKAAPKVSGITRWEYGPRAWDVSCAGDGHLVVVYGNTEAEAIAAWNAPAALTAAPEAKDLMALAEAWVRAELIHQHNLASGGYVEAAKQAFVTALQALSAPAGHVVVPVEPTDAMLVAGSRRHDDYFTEKGVYPRTKAVWRAMLNAFAKPYEADSGHSEPLGSPSASGCPAPSASAAASPTIASAGEPSITETAAVEALCKWRSAFQACTPGGSEFMTPESVREYMLNLKRETVEAKLEVARLRKDMRRHPNPDCPFWTSDAIVMKKADCTCATPAPADAIAAAEPTAADYKAEILRLRNLLSWASGEIGFAKDNSICERIDQALKIDYRCHVCGAECTSAPTPPEKAICPAHCPDHDYIYEHGYGHYCTNCGQEPPHDWFDSHERD